MGETIDERRAAYAAEGYDVTTATADHGGAAADGEAGRLVFTVADNVANDIERAAAGGAFPVTQVGYSDVAGYRLFLLAALDPDRETALLLAGGVERDRLAALRGTDRVRTVVRRADDAHALVLEHEAPDPFVEGIDGE